LDVQRKGIGGCLGRTLNYYSQSVFCEENDIAGMSILISGGGRRNSHQADERVLLREGVFRARMGGCKRRYGRDLSLWASILDSEKNRDSSWVQKGTQKGRDTCAIASKKDRCLKPKESQTEKSRRKSPPALLSMEESASLTMKKKRRGE